MKISFYRFVLTLNLFVFSSSCFGMTDAYKQSEGLIDFLCKHDYLSCGRYILQGEHIQHISDAIRCLGVNGIIDNPSTGSFVVNVAFVAAEVKEIDIATKLLMKLHDANRSNWLFEMIERNKEEITEESIKAALQECYTPLWQEQEQLRRQHANGVEEDS